MTAFTRKANISCHPLILPTAEVLQFMHGRELYLPGLREEIVTIEAEKVNLIFEVIKSFSDGYDQKKVDTSIRI